MIEVMIDLIVEEFKMVNPVLIAQKIEEEFGVEVSIFIIENYLEPLEDFERANREQYYTIHY